MHNFKMKQTILFIGKQKIEYKLLLSLQVSE